MDFTLQDLWWLKPKGPDNPLPALQLGAQIAQNKAAMDLKQADTINDFARTSLVREEMLAKQRIQMNLMAGNSEMARAVSEVTDWTDPEQIKRVYEVGVRYPMTVGGNAWQGVEYQQRNALKAKDLRDRAQARTEIDLAKLELQELLNDSRIELNDARIQELQSDIAFAERQQAVREGNLDLRRQEIGQKGQRLSLRQQRMYDNELKALNAEETALLKTASGEEAKRLRMNFNLRRRQLTDKFYAPTDTAPAQRSSEIAPPPAQPMSAPQVKSPLPPKSELIKGEFYDTKNGRLMWDGEKFIEQ